MKRSIFKSMSLYLATVSMVSLAVAQHSTPSEQRVFPITYGSRSDGLPDTMLVRGTISRVDYAPPACGELIFPATFEIKLDSKPKGYKHSFVYLVVPCLYRPEGAERFLNRRVELRVTKQEKERRPCFYDIGKSEIDSKGVPFYCAERTELLKSVTPE